MSGVASGAGAAQSRRRRIRMTPAEEAAFLRDHPKCALATIDQDGFPHVVAMGFFVDDDGAFCMTSYAKAQKVLNIRRNPLVGIMVEAGDAYAELQGVMVRGRCEIIDDTDEVRAAMHHRRRAGPADRDSSSGLDSAPKRVLLRITPLKKTSWDHKKLGGKY
ncbi:MAG: pyridoxamine 5'-phosphate oxidase family protein [Stellaceae bacterium]